MLDTAFWQQEPFSAVFASKPTQLGQVKILKDNTDCQVSSLPEDSFLALFRYLHRSAAKLKKAAAVKRVGLASDHASVYLLPMHGLSADWQQMSSLGSTGHPHYSEVYAGYLMTCSGPRQSPEALTRIQKMLCMPKQLDTTFYGDSTNLFANLIRGDGQQYRFYDKSHVALLTPFSHSPGCTVVLPREYLPSDIFSIAEDRFMQYVAAAFEVMAILKEGLKVDQVAVFFEGYEIDFAHIKLYPIPRERRQGEQGHERFFETYPGYLTTQEGPEMSEETRETTERLLVQILESKKEAGSRS